MSWLPARALLCDIPMEWIVFIFLQCISILVEILGSGSVILSVSMYLAHTAYQQKVVDRAPVRGLW